jgi:hypothetical protein
MANAIVSGSPCEYRKIHNGFARISSQESIPLAHYKYSVRFTHSHTHVDCTIACYSYLQLYILLNTTLLRKDLAAGVALKRFITVARFFHHHHHLRCAELPEYEYASAGKQFSQYSTSKNILLCSYPSIQRSVCACNKRVPSAIQQQQQHQSTFNWGMAR